jgi:hypothetical protein
MSEPTETTTQSQKPGSETVSVWMRPGTRLWLVTTTLTAAMLALATCVVIYNMRAARQKLDDRYSRLAAGIAEETDLRIESYKTLASVISNAVYDNFAEFSDAKAAQDAEASRKAAKASLDQAKGVRAVRPVTTGANHGAPSAFDDAADAWFSAVRRLQEADVAASKAQDALTAAQRAFGSTQNSLPQSSLANAEPTSALTPPTAVEPSAKVGDDLRGEQRTAVPPPAAEPSVKADDNSSRERGLAMPPPLAEPSPNPLRRQEQVAATVLGVQPSVRQSQYADAREQYTKALQGLSTAQAAEEDARHKAASALKARQKVGAQAPPGSGPQAPTADLAVKGIPQEKDLLKQFDKALRSEQIRLEPARLTFIQEVGKNLRLDFGEDKRRMAEVLASVLVGASAVQDRPEVVACPAAGLEHRANGSFLIQGRRVLFPIRAATKEPESQAPQTPSSKAEKDPGTKDPQAKKADGEARSLCLQIPIEALVESGAGHPRKGDHQSKVQEHQPFDELLLVERETCTVLQWSDTEPQARASTLPGCNTLDGIAKPAASAADKVGTSNTNPASAPELALIGGGIYRPFKQPVRRSILFEREGAESKSQYLSGSLLVIGLVRESTLDAQVRSLSPMVFLFFVALAAIAVSCWPIAKLWLIGQRSQYTRFDGAFVASSTLMATFVAVMVALAFVANARLTQRLASQLDAVVGEVSKRLNDSFDHASSELATFIASTEPLRSGEETGSTRVGALHQSTEFASQCRQLGDNAHFANWQHAEDDDHRWPICELFSSHPLTLVGPRSATAFWANPDGYEQIQQHDALTGQQPVNIALRSYFQRAKQTCQLSPSDPSRRPDVAEVVRSLTSTKKVLVVARAEPCTGSRTDGYRSGVAGFEQELTAFEQLALAPGLEWAVIDANGTIMLHSSIDEHHGHDFFDDLDSRTASRLRTAMLAHAPFDHHGEYRGARTLIRADLNPRSNWYVVALGSRRPTESILKSTMLTTATSFGVFVTAMALIAVALRWLAARCPRPRGKHAPVAAAPPSTGVSPSGDGATDSGNAGVSPGAPCATDSSSTRALLSPDTSVRVNRELSVRPHSEGVRCYAAVSLLFGVGALLLLGVTLVLNSRAPITPLLGGAALLVLLGTPKIPGVSPRARECRAPLPTGKWRDSLSSTYTLCCLTFCAAFVIAPTTICFVGSFTAATENAIRTEQVALIPPLGCESPKAPGSFHCRRLVDSIDPTLTTATWEGSSGYSIPQLTWPIPTLMGWLQPDYLTREESARLLWKRSARTVSLEPADLEPTWELRSHVPHLLSIACYSSLVLVVLAGLLAGIAVYGAARLSLRRLFFMDVLEERRLVRTSLATLAPKRPTLFTYSSPTLASRLHAEAKPLVLSASDLRDSPPAYASQDDQPSVVIVEGDPLRQVPEAYRNEWSDFLSRFFVVLGPGLSRTLHPGPRFSSPADFVREWEHCDADEQRVLAQLAIDGHASPHPKNRPVLRQLAARGLIDDDTLKVEDVEWSDYILRAVSSEQLRLWQAGEADVSWHVVRVPLIASVGVILCVVAISHPEIADNGALLLTPVAAGLPALLRYAAAFARGKRGDSTTA